MQAGRGRGRARAERPRKGAELKCNRQHETIARADDIKTKDYLPLFFPCLATPFSSLMLCLRNPLHKCCYEWHYEVIILRSNGSLSHLCC